jgi:AraC-like DNA-binding protein
MASGSNEIALAVNVKGRMAVLVRGAEVVLLKHDALFGLRIDIDRRRDRFLVLGIPRAATLSLRLDLDDAITRPIRRDCPLLQLLKKYLKVIQDRAFAATPELEHVLAAHIHDLIGFIIGGMRESSALSERNGMGAARLQALKADILSNINGGRLSLQEVAARQGISTSYVRKLFQASGTSFTKFALDQRLLEAHRRLTSPHFADHSISQIALSVCFDDLSYFNRAFRRRFGQAPSAIRRAVRIFPT